MKWAFLALGWAGALLCSGTLMDAALGAAQVFAASVMPSLFPVLVLGAWQAAGKRSRHACAGTLLLGLCSGSPGGARQVAAQWRRGTLSPRALRFLLGATGTMSPLFFTGAISAWLDGAACGWLMLACHWTGALLVGAGYAELAREGAQSRETEAQSAGPRGEPGGKQGEHGGEAAGGAGYAGLGREGAQSRETAADERPGLRALLGSAMDALLLVLGAMMLGACLFALLEKGLRFVWPGLPAEVGAVLHALLEIGGGAEAVAGAMGMRSIAALCALCSLGGVSLLLQNAGMLEGVASVKTLLGLRLCHALLSYVLCRAALLLWPGMASAAFAAGGAASGSAFPALSLLLALVLARVGVGRRVPII